MIKGSLKIGLIINSIQVPYWICTIINKIKCENQNEIVAVLYIPTVKERKYIKEDLSSQYNTIFWKVYKKIDRKIFKNSTDAFFKSECKIVNNFTLVEINYSSDHKIPFEEKHDITLKKLDLDVIINLTDCELEGPLFEYSKYGLWSIFHYDRQTKVGGPPGVWEVLNNEGYTSSTLEVKRKGTHENIIIAKSHTRTQYLSVSQNNNNNYLASVNLIPRMLKELSLKGGDKFLADHRKKQEHLKFYSKRIYKIPQNGEILVKLFQKILTLIKAKIEGLIYSYQWILLFNLNNGDKLSTNFNEFTKILPPKTVGWADPFIISSDNKKYYLFIEEINSKTGKGHISVMHIGSKGELSEPSIIIEKEYHLSYPFLIRDDENLYLIPESAENKQIELYKCIEFPFKWEFENILMDNIEAVDTTIIKKDGKYWLFANIKKHEGVSKDDELFLYYSDELNSKKWKSHPQNPIVTDVRRARPAGNLFKHNNKLYRPSQNCSKHYGYGMQISEIIRMDEEYYDEKLIDSIYPDWDNKILSTHTFNFNHNLTIIDAEIKRRKW